MRQLQLTGVVSMRSTRIKRAIRRCWRRGVIHVFGALMVLMIMLFYIASVDAVAL